VRFGYDHLKISSESIEMGIRSKPKKGKANLEIVEKLANNFSVSSSRIRIISGLKSKNKIIEII
jgi:uncharacterized protein YggU (UPF0235/DUF167 family)